jgi:hypothetical protein
MIRLTFACDGAAGRERIGECDVKYVIEFHGCGEALFTDSLALVKSKGWTFRRFGARFIVRCPRCEGLRVKRNEASAKRDTLREARKR